MADEDPNELFQQAADRCTELNRDVGEAGTTIESMVDRAGQLDQALDSNVKEVRNALQRLTERLEKAENDLVEAAQEAEAAVDGAIGQTADARKELEKLGTRGDQGTEAVDEAVGEAGPELGSRLQAATESFNEFGREVSDFSRATAEQVQATQKALKEFADEIDDSRDELEEKKEEWLKALDQYTTVVSRECGETVQALAAALKEQATGMLETGNSLVLDHNEAMEALSAGFGERAEGALAEALVPLSDALAAVSALAEKRSGELSAKVQTAVGKVQALVPELNGLAARLRKTDRLEV
jgi:flagellar biosynthesis chaperone FliJ